MRKPSPRQRTSLQNIAPRTICHTHPSVLMRHKSRFRSQHHWLSRMLDRRSLMLRQKSSRSSRSRLIIFPVWLFMYARLALSLCFNDNIGQVLSSTILANIVHDSTKYSPVSDSYHISASSLSSPHRTPSHSPDSQKAQTFPCISSGASSVWQ